MSATQRRLLAIGFVLSALTRGAAAQELPINTITERDQRFPAVAADAAGGSVVVWQSWLSDGNGWGAYARRLDPDGQPQGSDALVNTTTAGSQAVPAIGANASGQTIVAWLDTNGDDHIFAQRFDFDFQPVGAEFQVSQQATFGSSMGYGPAVAVSEGGGCMIAWTRDVTGQTSVWARVYDAAGVAIGDEFLVDVSGAERQARPAVAAAGDGAFWIVFEMRPAGQTWAHIFARRFDATGQPLADAFQVSDEATNADRSWPAMDIGAGGHCVVAWYNAGDSRIYARRYTPAGAARGTSMLVSELPAGTGTIGNHPDVGVSAEGQAVVTWHAEDADGGSRGVCVQRLDADGNRLGPQFVFNQYVLGHQQRPSLCITASGNVLLVWESDGQDGSGWGVFGRAATLGENRWQLPISGDWFSAGNWSFGVPVSSDRVFIEQNGTYAVSVGGGETAADAGELTLTPATGQVSLAVQGALGVAGPLTVGTYARVVGDSDSAIAAAGPVLLQGELETAGQLVLDDVLTVVNDPANVQSQTETIAELVLSGGQVSGGGSLIVEAPQSGGSADTRPGWLSGFGTVGVAVVNRGVVSVAGGAMRVAALTNADLLDLGDNTLTIEGQLILESDCALTGQTTGRLVMEGSIDVTSATSETLDLAGVTAQIAAPASGSIVHEVEAFHEDAGATTAAFGGPSVWDTFEIADDVRLVNSRVNAAAAEAMYVRSLVLPDAAVTLDLGGLTLYCLQLSDAGATIVPNGGRLVLVSAGGDFDLDGDVDLDDFGVFASCCNGSNRPPADTCPAGTDADLDDDGDVDLDDFAVFAQNFTGAM